MRDRNTTPTALLTDLMIIVMLAVSLFLFGSTVSPSTPEPPISTDPRVAARTSGLTPVAIEVPGQAVVTGIEHGLHEGDAAGERFQ